MHLHIKSVIYRDGAACQNDNYFEHPAIFNALWDEHSVMFFKSVADHSAPVDPSLAKVKVDPHAKNQGQTVQPWECWRTERLADGRYQTYYLPCS